MSKSNMKMALELVQMRLRWYELQRDEAIDKKEWSKMSGFDGIALGLLMAAQIIEKEMREG